MNAVSEESGTGHASTSSMVRTRRFGAVAVLALAAVSLSSCAVGQHAATAIDRPAIAGTGGSVGSIDLADVSIQAPNIGGRATGTKFYAAGDDAPMTLTIVNVGHTTDTLTSVTSTAFKSWNIVDTGAVGGTVATSQAVGPNEHVGLGITDTGVGTGSSPQTLVLRGLSGANLYPGTMVDITFTFATAGSLTLHVPVDLSSTPTTGSIAPIPTEPGI